MSKIHLTRPKGSVLCNILDGTYAGAWGFYQTESVGDFPTQVKENYCQLCVRKFHRAHVMAAEYFGTQEESE